MEENKLITQNEFVNEDIKNLIYTIRNKQVMLDSDVAMLYHYETKKVNQAVKRNINRFQERFCFKLTRKSRKTWGKKRFTLCIYRTRNSYASMVKYMMPTVSL